MDDQLKRLLDAEKRAEDLARQAEEDQEKMIQAALREARHAEERFQARTPDIHSSFLEKAEARAEQTVKELRKRYDERHVQLREMAEQREAEALDAAFTVLADPEI
ncbi:MAG: ATPase [Gammaproteobacteria bacterium]|nr:ATPase [Gammaproteobacteria bacterium]